MDTKYAYYSTSKGYRVVGGTAAHFLKADGSLDNNSYALANLTVPYTGATSDLTLADKNLNLTTGAISKFQNSVRIFNNVFQNTYLTAQTGILSLKFPQASASATMFDVTIKIYNYNNRSLGKIRVSFYKQTNISIHSTAGAKAIIEMSDNLPTTTVNVGIDVDGNVRINIGDITTAWASYLNFEVERLQTTYTGANFDWSKGWTSSIETVAPVVPDTYQSFTNIIPDILATRSYIDNVALLGSVPKSPIYLALSDLNTITTPGFYNQTADANATLARNYPIVNAGSLRVYKTINLGVIQEYSVYHNSATFRRIFNGTSWQIWTQVIDSRNGGTVIGGLTLNGNLNVVNNSTVLGSNVSNVSVPASGSAVTTHNTVFTNTNQNYGLAFGSLTSGIQYIQSTRFDDTATNYELRLNPNGGTVSFGGAINASLSEVFIQRQGVNKIRTGGTNGDSLILSSTSAIYLRPNGDAITTGEILINSSGNITTQNYGNASQWNNVSQAYITNPFFNRNNIISRAVNSVATSLDDELPNGGFISSYYGSSWGGSDRPNAASYGGYIKFKSQSSVSAPLDLDFYYNNGHGGADLHRLWFRSKNSTVGVTNWFEVATREWIATQLPANCITSNTDQLVLTGNKTTSGVWTYNGNVISNGQYFESNNLSRSRWLNTISINSTNKVAYIVVDGFIESTNRQLVIEVESIAGNGQYKKLKKVFNVNFNSANDFAILGSKYTELTGRDTDVRYGIGEVEKLSNTSLRIPLIWLSSNSSSANQVTVKTSVGDVKNLTFSLAYDATSALTTEIPYNTLVGSQILVNNSVFAGGVDITGGNTIYLRNLLPATRQDALTRVLRNELTSYVTNSGSTNYPATFGAGIRSERYSSATDQRGFDIFSGGNSGQIYFKTFSGSTTDTNWEMFASREWTALQLGSYVTQASLISQLGNYATLNGVQTFSNTITFSQSPIVPAPTLLPHAVNYGFMANAIEESQNAIVGYVGGNYIPLSQKGSANGVATLDSSGLIPSTQLPSYVDDVIEASSVAALNALPANEKQTGKIYVTIDTNTSYRWSGTVFVEISSGAVQSVNGQTAVVNLTYSDVGASPVNHTHTIAQVAGLQSALDGKVDDSQVLTNVPAGALFTDTIYTLPTATSTVKGGVEIFSDTVQTVASNVITTTANKTYGIQLNSAGQAVVNVPWANDNTTYTAGNGLTLSGTVFSLPVTISGSGNYITDVTQNTNGITVTKGTLPSNTLLVATSNSLGGVRLITDTVNNIAPNAATTTVGRSYAVQLNNNNQAIVNVPWTDNNTIYTSSNGIVLTGTNFAPTFGTTANTIAQGNDSRINNGQAAFDWGNHAGSGYAKLTSNQTFTNTNTFSKSPIIPNGTLDAHAVNVSQLNTKATGQENATAIGFSSGNIPTSDGGSYPYMYHNSGSYVALATQSYVQSNFLSTPNGTSVIISGSNLNNYLKTGFYRGSGLANAPLDNTGWWYVTVETHDNTWVTQKAISFGSGNKRNMIYQRTMDGGSWSDWAQVWTAQDFTTTNIQQWNYMTQYGLQLNADFTVHTGSGLMISDDHFGGESGIIDNKQRRFVAAKIGEYYKYGSDDKDGLEGINFHLEKKNVGIGGDADSENKVRVQGCVKALENFKSKDERPDTIFIPNGETATLRDEIINDESEYAIRLDPHEYEVGSSGSLVVDDRNRLIHVIGEQIKMTVDFKRIYAKQQIVIYNFDPNGGTMAVKVEGKTIASLSARCFLRLYITKSLRVIAERQLPCDFVW